MATGSTRSERRFEGSNGDAPATLSVVVSTYQWPEALDAVLRGLAAQSDPAFEVVVADDGSTRETQATVAEWRPVFGEGRLLHAWQPDDGFRLARVRNLGASVARGRHLVFIDGDCIPRRHFVAALRRGLIPGWFLAGTRLQLGQDLSLAVLRDHVPVESWSTATLLARGRGEVHGLRHLTPRDRRRPWRPGLPDFVPHGNAYGFCTAVAREDFEAVNGFDGRFVGWGEQDVDLAVRLGRLGLRCGQAGPRAAMLHLWHASNMPVDRPTWWLLQETLRSDRSRALDGYRELVSEGASERR